MKKKSVSFQLPVLYAILSSMKRIAIVTGASSGMGVCFARQLASEAFCLKKSERLIDEIWLIARRKDKLEETAQKIKDDAKESKKENLWPQVRCLPLDLNGKEGALCFKQILNEEKNSCGKESFEISVLVNNAGFGTYGEFSNTDTLREMEMIDVDCTSLTGLTGFSLPYMKKGARIINTASLASFMPLGNFAVYGACKAYVLSFSVALAAELKEKGISVTSLCPGPVSTEFADVASKGARKEVKGGLDPEKTVAHCIRASRKGKLYSMYAFKWRFKAWASPLVPRYLGAWFTYKFCKRPSN